MREKMKGFDLLNGMEEISEEYIEKAADYHPARRRRPLKALMTAAAVMVLLGVTVFAVSRKGYVWITGQENLITELSIQKTDETEQATDKQTGETEQATGKQTDETEQVPENQAEEEGVLYYRIDTDYLPEGVIHNSRGGIMKYGYEKAPSTAYIIEGFRLGDSTLLKVRDVDTSEPFPVGEHEGILMRYSSDSGREYQGRANLFIIFEEEQMMLSIWVDRNQSDEELKRFAEGITLVPFYLKTSQKEFDEGKDQLEELYLSTDLSWDDVAQDLSFYVFAAKLTDETSSFSEQAATANEGMDSWSEAHGVHEQKVDRIVLPGETYTTFEEAMDPESPSVKMEWTVTDIKIQENTEGFTRAEFIGYYNGRLAFLSENGFVDESGTILPEHRVTTQLGDGVTSPEISIASEEWAERCMVSVTLEIKNSSELAPGKPFDMRSFQWIKGDWKDEDCNVLMEPAPIWYEGWEYVSPYARWIHRSDGMEMEEPNIMSKQSYSEAQAQAARQFRVELAPGETKTVRLGFLVDADDLGHLYMIGKFSPEEGKHGEWVAVPLQ